MNPTPDTKKAEAQAVPFFTTLRRLARQVDNGVKEIQKNLEARSTQVEDTHHIAKELLLDCHKEMQTLKKNVRESFTDMRCKNDNFEATLQLCRDVVSILMTQLASIQEFLGQYGYIPSQGKAGQTTDGAAADSQSDTSTNESDIPEKRKKEKEKREMTLSPRLEDFGISSYTINLANRPPLQQTDFKVPSGVPINNVVKKRLDSVPTPFQNTGLTVTPSLFSSHCRSDSDMSWSPANTFFNTPNGAGTEDQMQAASPPEQSGLAKTLEFTDSPIPPVLQTPGMKQIRRMGDVLAQSQAVKGEKDPLASPVPPVFITPGLKPIPTKEDRAKEEARNPKVFKQLKLNDGPASVDSPVPPVLKTPGIKQITKGTSGATEPAGKWKAVPFVGRSNAVELEVPKMPELTFSLKDLEEMTMSFKNTTLTTFSERTWTSDLDDSRIPPARDFDAQISYGHPHQSNKKLTSGKESQKHAWDTQSYNSCSGSRTDNLPSVPPLPQLHTNRFGFMSDISGILEMPATPELRTTRIPESFMSKLRHRDMSKSRGHSKLPRSVKKEKKASSEMPMKHDLFREERLATSSFTGFYSNSCKYGYNADSASENKPASRETVSLGRSMCSAFNPLVHATTDVVNSTGSSMHKGVKPFMKSEPAEIYEPNFGLSYNKENVQTPPLPEHSSQKLGEAVISKAWQPLADSNLDLPPTPKFMGNYHFVTSK